MRPLCLDGNTNRKAAEAASTTWTQETVHVRGKIEQVEGQTLMVKSRNGTELRSC